MSNFLVQGVVAATLVGACVAQHVQWLRQGHPRPTTQYARLGDLDADGEQDFAITVDVPDGTTAGRREIWAVSGRDGAWWPLLQPATAGSIGGLLPHGDADGDGQRDFLVGRTSQGAPGIRCISGRTLQVLFDIPIPPPMQPFANQWGVDIEGDIDVNGDGRADVLVADLTGGTAHSSVWAYDHTGAVIFRASSSDPSIHVGWGPTVAKFVDWDRDGCDDFLVGLYEPTAANGVELVSGRTRLPFFRIVGPTALENLNQGVEKAGDMDGDGLPDILLGGISFWTPSTIRAYSSATLQPIHVWNSPWFNDGFGRYMIGTLDVDQDGIADVIAAHPGDQLPPSYLRNGSVKVLSGRDGALMMRFFDYPISISGAEFGPMLAMPPRSGSVFPRFVAVHTGGNYPSPHPYSWFTFGRAYMIEGGPEGAERIGEGCAGTLPDEPRIGLRELGPTAARVTVSGAPSGAVALLVLGLAPYASPVNLSAFGFPGCALSPVVCEVGLKVCGTSGIDAGYTYHDFTRGFQTPSALSLPVYGQWLVLGTGTQWPGGLSKALRWHF